MQFFTYVVLAMSATAAVIDPQHQRSAVADQQENTLANAPRALELALEVRHIHHEPRASNATAGSIESRASNDTKRADVKSLNQTKRADVKSLNQTKRADVKSLNQTKRAAVKSLNQTKRDAMGGRGKFAQLY